MTSRYYQRKPHPVQAVKWDGKNAEEVKEFVTSHGGRAHVDHTNQCLLTCYDGDKIARPGEWIVLEPEGKFFCGSQQWFESQYERLPAGHVLNKKKETPDAGKTA